MRELNFADSQFQEQLDHLLAYEEEQHHDVEETVADIVRQVRTRGDSALVDYTRQFDRLDIASAEDLAIHTDRLQQALDQLPQQQRSSLQQAAERIRQYHEKQRMASWQYEDDEGTLLGQQVTPLDRVGIYVPGGKATYPSSVLMNAIPAKVAGVPEIVMVVPTPDGEVNGLVLAAAAVAGVDKVFTIGGAQAVAALAYGTESIPKVDKIVGPGNIYVATAKKQVFGVVGIDMIAGPSEICIYADENTDPDWLAMDLFSQAEHDENAQSILIASNATVIENVKASVEKLLPGMERKEIIERSLSARGGYILVGSEDEALQVINRIAPEHLELSVSDPDRLLPGIRHAGAIFMGRYTAEALGDYCAGPNHVLPTAGTARFSSPLGVYDFQKRSSLIKFSARGASNAGRIASVLARGEGLTAHARSAEYRIQEGGHD